MHSARCLPQPLLGCWNMAVLVTKHCCYCTYSILGCLFRTAGFGDNMAEGLFWFQSSGEAVGLSVEADVQKYGSAFCRFGRASESLPVDAFHCWQMSCGCRRRGGTSIIPSLTFYPLWSDTKLAENGQNIPFMSLLNDLGWLWIVGKWIYDLMV